MLWVQYLPVLFVLICNYNTITVTGLRITSQNTKGLKNQFDVKNKEGAPSYRQVIFDPNVVNTLRRPPRPYPFQPLHVHWSPHIEPVEIIPNSIPVDHYRKVPVAIRVPKYENVPEPYYVPYKPSPDYTITHVDVYHPGL